MHFTPDQQRSLSMFPHVYHGHQEVSNLQRCHISSKVWYHSKYASMGLYYQIADGLSIEIIKPNIEKTKDPSMHLQA